MKSQLPVIILLFVLIIFLNNSFPCTTAIITGKYTVDGRPLIWKHRDTGDAQNKLMYFKDGKYNYIGLVNSKDIEGNEVWQGCNSAGFAIMNSASYNLKINDTTKIKDREGIIMKQALQSCATLEDFENLLTNLPKPLGVEANFGVIDAQGGAAYYETNNFTFTKIDVNDPASAPNGYIIRTNYSFTGKNDKGYGYIRYANAETLFSEITAADKFSYKYILQSATRNLKHSLTGVDLMVDLPQSCNTSRFVYFEDFIPRYSSASTTVVRGVKPGESPDLTTMWTILGWQLCSVAIPTWVSGGEELPEILVANSKNVAPLCDMALELKKQCYPVERGSGKKYLNIAALMNQQGDGIMQKLKPLENEILSESEQYFSKWEKNGINAAEIKKLYNWISEKVLSGYKKNFNL